MEIGSKEWMEACRENFNFPCMVAIYYTSDNGFVSTKIQTKSTDPDKLNFRTIKPPSFIGGVKSALYGVYYMENAEEYKDITLKAMNAFERKEVI